MPFLKDVSPTSINLQVYEGATIPDVTLSGTLDGDLSVLFGKTVYVFITIPDPLFATGITPATFNNTTPNGAVKLRGLVAPKGAKTYSGNLTIKVCLDSNCQTQLGNSNYPVPYSIVVKPAPPLPTISVVTDQLAYRQTATLTLTGKNLDSVLKVACFGCVNVTEIGVGTSTQRKFTAKITGTGTVPLYVDTVDNVRTSIGTLTVPTPPSPQVSINTTMGNIVMELNPVKAPVSVDNFLNYVESKSYAGTIFHRVINNFVIQGGGYTPALAPIPTFTPILLESDVSLKNQRGTVAMARTSEPNTATSQFFINVVDNPSLNANFPGVDGYAVFGKVLSGMDVVDKIKAVTTKSSGGFNDVPVTPIVINSVIQIQ
ncbi:hypothetical protein GCM10011396_53870 [Undibacterium terreum]|uniref:peptidylprolyl isomerase n=2 Tax=Undibacterium terreum TaxID=1224302 RepID=A0A916V0L0_9BURK|nr:hypothetical protein GCM10011396_53870 [Undibacterium terreum]